MPELPEVETVCRGLAQNLTGLRITRVRALRRNLRKPLPEGFEKSLSGRTILNIDRRAKYILLHLTGGLVLLIHLGMSGRMLLTKKAPETFLKHDHVVFNFSGGQTLVFNDARRFGLMALATEETLNEHPLLRHLGPEPLGEMWDGAQLYTMLHESRAPVKSVIMDQRKLVGVGNIYACESLFRARIHPARRADKVRRQEAVKLANAIREVLEEAIVSGGSTLRDYVRSSGDAGYFQHHFSVYGRQRQPCFKCGNAISVLRQSGRSSFFCGHCQK